MREFGRFGRPALVSLKFIGVLQLLRLLHPPPPPPLGVLWCGLVDVINYRSTGRGTPNASESEREEEQTQGVAFLWAKVIEKQSNFIDWSGGRRGVGGFCKFKSCLVNRFSGSDD